VRADEAGGDNPPDSAIVNYWLKQDSRSPVTLDLDAAPVSQVMSAVKETLAAVDAAVK
jgi:hypothetical protein